MLAPTIILHAPPVNLQLPEIGRADAIFSLTVAGLPLVASASSGTTIPLQKEVLKTSPHCQQRRRDPCDKTAVGTSKIYPVYSRGGKENDNCSSLTV